MTKTDWARRIHEPFILAALVIALTAGFGYGLILVEAIGHHVTLGAWWAPLVQAHGHAQLFGWLGLFVIGMGLYFLPRLFGGPLRGSQGAAIAFVLLVGGIGLRSVSQPTLGFVEIDSNATSAARSLWLASAILEMAGAIILGWLVIQTTRAAPQITAGSPGWSVIPFIATAGVSFALAILMNTLATLFAFSEKSATLDGAWDTAIIQLMLFGMAIPIAFAFSVRNLPLFLRLAPPPRKEFRWVAAVYVIGLILRMIPLLPFIPPFEYLNVGGAIGWILQSVCILVFIWELDLIRRKPPWITQRVQVSRPDLDDLRKPTRPGFPDAGEFGRFELLIYSAFVWLTIVAVIGIVRGVSVIVGIEPMFSTDLERHSLTIGFISLLIFGMAPRLAPGFSGKRRVAHPRLVVATFILGNLAGMFRVFPLLAPNWDYSALLLAPSGGLGWVAVLLLTINLVATRRLPDAS